MYDPYSFHPAPEEGMPGWLQIALLGGLAYLASEALQAEPRPARDTYRYRLLTGGAIVYQGISNDPLRRVREHVRDGKLFDCIEVLGYARTRRSSLNLERQSIEGYRLRRGRRPKYNRI